MTRPRAPGPLRRQVSVSDALVHPSANVSANATLAEGVVVAATAVVEAGCQIGAGTRIGSGAIVCSGSILGPECEIHPRAVIGAAPSVFGMEASGLVREPWDGHVELGHGVQVGAGAVVEAGSRGATVVGDRTAIGPLVVIGHDVRIEADCLVSAQAGIAGRARIGRHAVLLGQSGVSCGVRVGHGARVGPRTGAVRDVQPNADLLGWFATPAPESRRQLSAIRRLPSLLRRLRRVERLVGVDRDI